MRKRLRGAAESVRGEVMSGGWHERPGHRAGAAVGQPARALVALVAALTWPGQEVAGFLRLFAVLIALRVYRTGSGLHHLALFIRVMEPR
jgi:hypothetical protein